MSRFAAVVCLALIANPGTLAAKPLAPSSKWVVDFGDNRCVAQRTYGGEPKPFYLLAKASAVGDGLQLTVAVKGPNSDGVQEKAKLYLGIEPIELLQLRYGIEKKQVRTVNLTKIQTDQLAGATELRWSAPNIDHSLPLGPMKDLIRVMEQCRSGLAEYWNGTEERKALLKQGARLDKPVGRLFSSSDYPNQAVFANQSGTAKVVGLVDEKGGLADCMVVETSGIAVLDAQTCIMIHKRGKFVAAIGPDDKPTKSVFVQRVRWEMP